MSVFLRYGFTQKAIENNRKLEMLLTQMRELSCQILDATTQGVQKRKRNK